MNLKLSDDSTNSDITEFFKIFKQKLNEGQIKNLEQINSDFGENNLSSIDLGYYLHVSYVFEKIILDSNEYGISNDQVIQLRKMAIKLLEDFFFNLSSEENLIENEELKENSIIEENEVNNIKDNSSTQHNSTVPQDLNANLSLNKDIEVKRRNETIIHSGLEINTESSNSGEKTRIDSLEDKMKFLMDNFCDLTNKNNTTTERLIKVKEENDSLREEFKNKTDSLKKEVHELKEENIDLSKRINKLEIQYYANLNREIIKIIFDTLREFSSLNKDKKLTEEQIINELNENKSTLTNYPKKLPALLKKLSKIKKWANYLVHGISKFNLDLLIEHINSKNNYPNLIDGEVEIFEKLIREMFSEEVDEMFNLENPSETTITELTEKRRNNLKKCTKEFLKSYSENID